MANFAKGLAAGFESGYKLGEMYRAGKMRRELEEAQKEKEFGRYSQEQADKLQALSKETDFPNMLDEKGDPLKPKYKFTIKPGSTEYDVIPLTYSEAPPAAAAAVANLTPEQEAYLRNIEAAKDRSGRPYYSVDRGEGGLATVRARPVSDGGGFEYYNPSQAPMGSIRYLAEETAAYTEDGRPPAQVVITPEEIKAREAERAELFRQYGSTAEFRPTAGLAKQGGPSVGAPTGDAITYSPDVIEYLGKTYEQGLTPGKLSDKQKNAALMDKYAQILSAYDPVEGMKFKVMAEQERRAAEKAPLELENLAQNIASGKIDLETKGFTLEDIKKVRSLTEWMSTNPNATTKDIFAQADKLKLSTKARSEVIQQLTGITKGELDLAKTQITKEISGMNRKQLLQAHRDNPNITPGAHYEEVLDNKGNISLYLVDTATGKRLTSKPDFIGSAAEVDQYLRTAAVAQDTLLDFIINLRKSNADIYSKEAYAAYLGQKGSALGAGGAGLGRGGRRGRWVPMQTSDGKIIFYNPETDETKTAPSGTLASSRSSSNAGQAASKLTKEQSTAWTALQKDPEFRNSVRAFTNSKDELAKGKARQKLIEMLRVKKLPEDILDLGGMPSTNKSGSSSASLPGW